MINYNEINERAYARRRNLQRLEDVLERMPAELAAACSLSSYLQSVEEAYHTLDAEGRDLLPEDLSSALRCLRHCLEGLSSGLIDKTLRPICEQLENAK